MPKWLVTYIVTEILRGLAKARQQSYGTIIVSTRRSAHASTRLSWLALKREK